MLPAVADPRIPAEGASGGQSPIRAA